MNVLLLPDKFKGSLTAPELIEVMTRAIKKAIPGAAIHYALASDGGDGFLDAIAQYRKTQSVSTSVLDPLGREMTAGMLVDQSGEEAFIEMAKASGIVLLSPEERNAMLTSSRGTGMQIKEAIQRGCRKLYIGLGGSATNDAGMGMAVALGYQFLDSNGNPLAPIGGNLLKVSGIDKENVLPALKDTAIFAVNDVNNPLFGPEGAAHVYAAQKGAGPQEIELLDQGLQHLDQLVQEQLNQTNANLPGAGAAGGAAFGLKSFLNAEFISGTAFLLDLAQIPELMQSTHFDYIITGEGKIDEQTLSGKWINGVMQLGSTYEVPVVAVCGILEGSFEALKEAGLHEIIEVRDKDQSLDYNMKNASTLVANAVFEYFRDI